MNKSNALEKVLPTKQTASGRLPPAALNWPRFGLVILLLLYLGCAFALSMTIPLSKAPDEYVHLLYSRFIVENGRLPITPEERQTAGYKADQPPLYYGLVALTTGWIETAGPPVLKMTWDSPRRKLVDLVLPRAMIVRTEDETWPYRGQVLGWMLGRWLSILCGAVTIILVYLTALEILSGLPPLAAPQPTSSPFRAGVLALAAAAVVAFTPAYLFISSVLNDDNLAGVVVALFFYLLVRLGRGSQSPWTLVALGALMGLAIITKYSTVVLPLELALALILIGRAQGWPRYAWAHRWSICVAVAALVAGWWFIFVGWHFNEIDRLGLPLGLIRPLLAGDASDPTMARLSEALADQDSDQAQVVHQPFYEWVLTFFSRFWETPVFGAAPLYPPLYTVLLMLLFCGLSLWGLGRIWRQGSEQHRFWLYLLALHLLIFFLLPFVRYVISGQIHDTAQARHMLFPGATAFGMLLAWGASAWLPAQRRLWPTYLLVLVLFGLSLAQLFYFRLAFPAPLPVRTAPELAQRPPHPLAVTFADGFKLVGYDYRLRNDPSVVEIGLYWQSLANAHEDYLTEISLLDEQGRVVVQTAAHPAHGRYPTRAWDPGDAIHDVIALPLTGISPGSYGVRLRLRGWETWLPTTGGAEAVILTQVDLPAAAKADTSPQHILAGKSLKGFSVWNQGRLAGPMPLYRYLADIPITINPFPLQGQVQLWLVGPDHQRRPPVTAAGPLQTFIVEYDWPSGEYRLEAEVETANSGVERVESEPVLRVENNPRPFQPPAMSHRLDANFDDKIVLLGYDLPSRRVQPSGGLPVVLHWQALRRMREDYVMFVRLLDTNQQVWGGYDRLPQETYSTILWVPGEVVSDGFVAPIKADAPQGMYYLAVGFYDLQEGQPVSLPLVQNGSPTDITRVLMGPVKVGGPPPGVTLNRFSPQVVRDDPFGDKPIIRLKGYDLDLQAGQLHLTLFWQSEAQTEIDYTRFVHLRDPQDQTVAQSDGLPGGGSYLTSLWDPGEVISDTVTVPLPAELPAGEYTLAVGLYEAATGQRLPVPASAEDNSLRLTQVRLP